MKALALLLLVACADANALNPIERSGDLDSGNPSLDDTAGGLDTRPSSWSLGARLVLEDGLPVAGESSLTVDVSSAADASLCPIDAAIASVTAGPSPDEAIHSWWSAPLPSGDSDDCDALPSSVWVGLGDYDRVLEPYLPRAPEIMEGAASSLNGAYVSEDGGHTVWIFGVAGPAVAFDGDGDAAASIDDMNGAWLVVPLFDLPLP